MVMKQAAKKKPLFTNKYVKWVWMGIAGPVILLFVVVLLTSIGLFGRLPTIEDLANPRSNLASEIISADQQLLGKFYIENRSNVHFEELPKSIVDALVST